MTKIQNFKQLAFDFIWDLDSVIWCLQFVISGLSVLIRSQWPGFSIAGARVEFVTFKVRAGLPKRPFRIPLLQKKEGTLDDCTKGERPAFSMIRKDYIPFRVYDRSQLFPGASIKGPGIIEEKESTIVIGEDAEGTVDEYGFVWINLNLKDEI